MPHKMCREPYCGEYATSSGRCVKHTRERERVTHPNRGIYNSKRWQQLRKRVLFEQPLCLCGDIATDADHIVPIKNGGAPWDRTNIQSLCRPCHSTKTNAEMRGRV